MKTMHLFAGAGGGLLADLILGHTPIVAVEWDKNASAILRERAAEGWFSDLDVWEGDVRDFDPARYAEVVDVIHAGFPCQDISAAGNQAGIGTDTRSGLYREVLRIASIVRPRIIFLENVAAITSRTKDYLEVIAKDLLEIGYGAQWLCLSAADIGANHKRERWWCMCRPVADTSSQRLPKPGYAGFHQAAAQTVPGMEQQSERCSGFVADASSLHAQGVVASYIDTQEREKPGNGQTGPRCDAPQRRQAESRLGGVADGLAYRMDENWWGVEPDIPRITTIIKSRSARLKALGNGQVPLQAAVAWRILQEAAA